jgi:hypothetical protein
MAQLKTVIGLTTLALNLGEGGDMLQPMEIALARLPYSLNHLPASRNASPVSLQKTFGDFMSRFVRFTA